MAIYLRYSVLAGGNGVWCSDRWQRRELLGTNCFPQVQAGNALNQASVVFFALFGEKSWLSQIQLFPSQSCVTSETVVSNRGCIFGGGNASCCFAGFAMASLACVPPQMQAKGWLATAPPSELLYLVTVWNEHVGIERRRLGRKYNKWSHDDLLNSDRSSFRSS